VEEAENVPGEGLSYFYAGNVYVKTISFAVNDTVNLAISNRVGLQISFNKEAVDFWNGNRFDKATYTVTVGGKTLATGFIAVDGVDDGENYVITIPGVGPEYFAEDIVISGVGFETVTLEGGMNALLASAKEQWTTEEKTEWANFADALLNLGKALKAEEVVTPNVDETKTYDALNKTGEQVDGLALYLSDTIGYKIFLNEAVTAVKMGGEALTVYDTEDNGITVRFLIHLKDLELSHTVTFVTASGENTVTLSVAGLAKAYGENVTAQCVIALAQAAAQLPANA
jgi:hypothetical protein